MRTKCLTLLAVLGLLLAWGGVASAATIVHNSTETYYASGGTQVDDHLAANNDFTVGDTSGSQTWQVDEVVYHDDTVAGTTRFAYTVRNLNLASNITSFSLQNNGVQPLSFPAATAPTGWSFASSPTHWTWLTTGSGISQGDSLNSMNVWVQGLVPVGYSTTTIVAGATPNSADWVVSAPTPEPGTLFLIGAGLAAAGTWGRQTFFRTPRPQDVA